MIKTLSEIYAEAKRGDIIFLHPSNGYTIWTGWRAWYQRLKWAIATLRKTGKWYGV